MLLTPKTIGEMCTQAMEPACANLVSALLLRQGNPVSSCRPSRIVSPVQRPGAALGALAADSGRVSDGPCPTLRADAPTTTPQRPAASGRLPIFRFGLFCLGFRLGLHFSNDVVHLLVGLGECFASCSFGLFVIACSFAAGFANLSGRLSSVGPCRTLGPVSAPDRINKAVASIASGTSLEINGQA